MLAFEEGVEVDSHILCRDIVEDVSNLADLGIIGPHHEVVLVTALAPRAFGPGLHLQLGLLLQGQKVAHYRIVCGEEECKPLCVVCFMPDLKDNIPELLSVGCHKSVETSSFHEVLALQKGKVLESCKLSGSSRRGAVDLLGPRLLNVLVGHGWMVCQGL